MGISDGVVSVYFGELHELREVNSVYSARKAERMGRNLGWGVQSEGGERGR